MYLAVINNATNVVENTIVPPQGAQVWFCADGYTAVLTDVGKIGDVYDGQNFVSQTLPE